MAKDDQLFEQQTQLTNKQKSLDKPKMSDPSPLTDTEKPTVRFADDLAAHLLSVGGSVGPGNFLSRSQDNLSTSTAGRRRKPVASSSVSITGRRPMSTIGLPKSGLSTGHKSKTLPGSAASTLSNFGVRKVSSSNGGVESGKHSAPCGSSSIAMANGVKSSSSAAASTDAKSRKTTPAACADARITKTKLTVTELQKQKQELESQVSELVQKAEHKHAELATLKMEIRHLKEDREAEVQNLRRENDRLRSLLSSQSGDNGASAVRTLIDTSTSPFASSNVLDSDVNVCGMDSAEQSEVCSAPAMAGGDGVLSSGRAAADWDRQSTSSMSEVSLACLQDRIVQMEETHYSTNEELQATLQELTDLQDIVNDMTKENAQLSEDKGMLLESLCNQTQKLNNCRLQIDNLKHLLLSGTELRVRNSGGNSRSSGFTSAEHQQQSEREQQLVELLKNTHDEHEELLAKYKLLKEETGERTEMIAVLRDRARLLDSQIDNLSSERKSLEEQLRDCKQLLDRDKREIVRLTNAYEKERCRVEELLRQPSATGNKDEMQNLLDKLRSEKAFAENRVHALEEAMTAKAHEAEDLRRESDDLKAELRSSRSETDKNVASLDERINELERECEYNQKQVMELRAGAIELEERCQRYSEDKKEYRANILTLQKSIDDVMSERDRLKRELAEEQTQRKSESDEWRQFQADLQVAVVVANDFKMEAQRDIELLATENSQLRDQMSTLSAKLEKMRASRSSPTTSSKAASAAKTASSPTTVSPGPDLRARMEGYLTSVERSLTTASPAPAAPTASASFEAARTTPKFATVEPMKGLSVRALVESLENSGTQTPSVNLRAAAPMLRSPGSTRASPQVTVLGSNSVEIHSPLSKSSSHLATRPVSVDGVEGLLAKQAIKSAASETEVQTLVPAPLRGSQMSQSAPVPDVVINAQASAIDVSQTKPAKSILVNRTPVGGQRRNTVYMNADNKDPLAKLMKDAPRGSRRNALLRWCQNRTADYKNVEITNFSSSWNDGLAFCALLHSFSPDVIPYKSLDPKDKRRNFSIAFHTAEKLGIPCSLNVDEMLGLERPDWQSVMGYVTSIYNHFEGHSNHISI